jgi:cytochrome P450 family 4
VYSNPVIARHIAQDITLDGKRIPKGTTVIVDTINMHHNPELYPEPLEYRPERFLGKIAPFTFLTWSAGPRNCVGQKFAIVMLKTIISTILRKYRIESLIPRTEMKPVLGFITRPSMAAHTRFIKRHP